MCSSDLAVAALASLQTLLQPVPVAADQPQARPSEPPRQEQEVETTALEPIDYLNLSAGHRLTHKFIVEKKLGRGSFGVVYKVIDTLGDVARTVKLIVSDRHSTLERLKKEYRHLVQIPEHPHVVRVLDADVIPDRGIPLMIGMGQP